MNDATRNGDALRRARFVRLEEAEQCRSRARCQVRTLMQTYRAEWARRNCVAGRRCSSHYGCTRAAPGPTLRYFNTVDVLQIKRRSSWPYAPILLNTKRDVCPQFRTRVPHPLRVGYGTQLVTRVSSTNRMTSASLTTLCSTRM